MTSKKKIEKFNRGEIVIYKPSKNEVELKVRLEHETVWLTQKQMAALFDKRISTINEHIKNIFKEGELKENSVIRKFRITAADGKTYETNFYDLDVIISVGYRVKSLRGTQFRIWANKILKQYLVNGYVINKKRLSEARSKFNQLRGTISFLQKKSKAKLLKGQEKGILNLLADYSKTLLLLGKYDKEKLKIEKGKKDRFILEYKDCLNIVSELKKNLVAKGEAGNIFGNEVGGKFEGVVKNIYQTFNGKELYQSVENKAANLLYLTIKDHYFTDGNKRIGSFLFVYFLDRNSCLYRESGEKKINDNALTALALLVAESKPREKIQMIALITQLLR